MTMPGGGPEFRLAAGRFCEVIMTLPWEKIASTVLPKLIGPAVDKLTRKRWDAAWAGVYGRWESSFQSPNAGEEKLNAAFEEFFCRKPVIDELAKVSRDQYRDVD